MGTRFFAPVLTGPGTHPASFTIGTGSLSRGTLPGRGADTHPVLVARLKKKSEPPWPVLVRTLPFYLQAVRMSL